MEACWTPEQRRMLFRFSLYGFLKNQRYFEAFLVLAFLEKGLSYFQIGLLVGFGSFCTNLLEIPSGAVADIRGRRMSMVLSFAAYTVSFVVLGMANSVGPLMAAMFFFGVGEAFRTGTHKSMIFNWLQAIGRERERVHVYGYTRSWSQKGSALSALIAAGLVFVVQDYDMVFWLSALPCLLNIINFLGYPSVVEGAPREATAGPGGELRHVVNTAREAWRHRMQRRLLLESTGFEGVFKVVKDYLQPVLQQSALALPLLLALEGTQRTALVVGGVYAALHLLSSAASRRAHILVAWRGADEDRASRFLWQVSFISYAALFAGMLFNTPPLVIPAYIVIFVVQNLWRPALVSRLDACSDSRSAATLLSIESQTHSLFAMVAAPLLGLAVDHLGLWPVGLIGVAVSLGVLGMRRARVER